MRRLGRLWERFVSAIASLPKRRPKGWRAGSSLWVGVPPACIAYTTLNIGKGLPLQDVVKQYLAEQPAAVAIILAWPILWNAAFGLFEDWANSRTERLHPKFDELLAVQTAIDEIEAMKLHRFAEFAKKVEADRSLAADAFLQITQPVLQLTTIVENLHHVLRTVLDDGSVQIVLASMKDGVPVGWRCHMPNARLLPDSLLGDERVNTMFASCARAREPQVIPDIESHLERKKKASGPSFVPVGQEADRGSIICIPLYSSFVRRVLYVLSIKSDVPNRIGPRFSRRHRILLSPFENRILLEAHLEIVRQQAGG